MFLLYRFAVMVPRALSEVLGGALDSAEHYVPAFRDTRPDTALTAVCLALDGWANRHDPSVVWGGVDADDDPAPLDESGYRVTLAEASDMEREIRDAEARLPCSPEHLTSLRVGLLERRAAVAEYEARAASGAA